MRVFEWGSGSSTIFFAKHDCEVISVEHDEGWYAHLTEHLEGRSHVERYLVPATELGGYEPYVAVVEDLPDASLDIILVDGRARIECARRARPKVRPGGVIILDDSERERYCSVFAAFPPSGWETIHLEGPKPACRWPVFTRTTFFRRRP